MLFSLSTILFYTLSTVAVIVVVVIILLLLVFCIILQTPLGAMGPPPPPPPQPLRFGPRWYADRPYGLAHMDGRF